MSGSSFAQCGMSMYEGLDLTETQKTQMQDLHEDHRTRMQAAHEVEMAATKSKMAEFLTAEQMKALAERMENRKLKMQKGNKSMHNKKHSGKYKMRNKNSTENTKL